MVLTDGLDGYLARKLKRVTELGKILDPVADKIAIDAILVFLTARGEFPGWALVIVLVRDVGILVGAWFVTRRSGSVPAANALGKLTLVVLGAMTLVYAGDMVPLEASFLMAGIAFSLASGAWYAVVMRRALAPVVQQGL